MKFKLSTTVLYIVAVILLIISSTVVYADFLVFRLFQEQQKTVQSFMHADAMPVLQPVLQPTPVLDSEALQDLTPVRAPREGDIPNVRFPEYDTGTDAKYSYQSDELRIAVHEVQENGVTYYLADIWMRNINCFRTAFSSGEYRGRRESAEKISQDNNAILAVNGDFLGGLVLRNSVLYRKATRRPEPTPATPASQTSYSASRPERSTCVLYYDGTVVTEEYRTFRSIEAVERGAWQGWQFGPTLVRNGEAVKDVKQHGRNPRCVLGYYEPGHYVLIVVDGRSKGHSIGMNLHEVIDVCLRLELVEAYNLDGGGSAIMTFGGEIINVPSGTQEARNLTDMVIIGDYLTPDMLFEPAPVPVQEQEDS